MTINTFNLRYRLATLQQEARLEQLRFQLNQLEDLFGRIDRLITEVEASLAATTPPPPDAAAGDLDVSSLFIES